MSPQLKNKLATIAVLIGSVIAVIAGIFELTVVEGPGPAPTGSFQASQRPISDFSFVDGAGRPVRLADFAGKVVLLNVWATWCAPCVRELPSLDRLQAELGGADFQVVAVAQDRGGAAVVQPFMEKHGVKALSAYFDALGAAGTALGVPGLPTSILIGRDGREVARMLGVADWGTPTMRRQIISLVGQR